MTTSILLVSVVLKQLNGTLTVVGCVLLATDQKLRVKKLTIVAGSNLVDGLSCRQFNSYS
jgi:hypothetical protein